MDKTYVWLAESDGARIRLLERIGALSHSRQTEAGQAESQDHLCLLLVGDVTKAMID